MAFRALIFALAFCGCSGQSTDPFDCEAGKANWKYGWSDSKKEWCCANKQIGCPETTPPPPPPPAASPPAAAAAKPAAPSAAEVEAKAQEARRLKQIEEDEAKKANLFVISEDQTAYVKATLVQDCTGASCDYRGTATIRMNCTMVKSCTENKYATLSFKGASSLSALQVARTIATDNKVTPLLTGSLHVASVSNYIKQEGDKSEL
eukprot:TRINITY_DN59461_c0_g1_i1.p1 TRINITY_DN59461_c0_g1~~TRINITY_DN59461_c0_g1_i1.p1  ORF type:complete len:206 (-),score=60.76 TRINITY_DN59461_c0_g1_i1:71-688(-)